MWPGEIASSGRLARLISKYGLQQPRGWFSLVLVISPGQKNAATAAGKQQAFNIPVCLISYLGGLKAEYCDSGL
jgi:hypothetical protein